MEEQKSLKKKLIKHIIYNIIGFIVIFIVCGLFIFLMVKGITYRGINQELYDSKRKILEANPENMNIILESNYPDYIENPFRESWIKRAISEYQDLALAQKIVNPNVQIILRDENKEIINEDYLGRLYEYKDQIEFDTKKMDKIYELTLDNKYHYKVLNFVFKRDFAEDRYIQLLINIDSEKYLVTNYFRIISLTVTVGIVLSIFASYILSKKTLKPLRDNMVKQMEFVQNVSHELRTPLTIIQAKQEILLQEPNSKIIDKSEDIILTLNETKRLSKLIKDLMLLSRADSDGMKLQKENINIDEFIKEIISPYKEIAEMQEKNMVLNLDYKADIDVDTNKFYQLMIILLDNAIKYTETNDSIEVKTYLKDNKFVLEVADTGIGISDEGMTRIFERFYREDKARNRETGGSGLGLSIASSIVTAHGGTIKVSHNTPKGSIFIVRLPK